MTALRQKFRIPGYLRRVHLHFPLCIQFIQFPTRLTNENVAQLPSNHRNDYGSDRTIQGNCLGGFGTTTASSHEISVLLTTMESSYVAIQPRDGNASLAITTMALQQQAQSIVHQQGFMITSEEQRRREKRRQKKWTVLIAIIGIVGFFVALSAIIIEASTVSYLAFVFPMVLGPYAIHQRRKLNKLPTLVFVMNQIRDQINRLMIENPKLYNENARLEGQIQRLHDSETKLEAFVKKSGHDVDTICTLVKENAETQRQMKVWFLCFNLYIFPRINFRR